MCMFFFDVTLLTCAAVSTRIFPNTEVNKKVHLSPSFSQMTNNVYTLHDFETLQTSTSSTSLTCKIHNVSFFYTCSFHILYLIKHQHTVVDI